MNILVGCEESQKVTNAFRKLGHNAISCDIVPTRGNPDHHIQMDVVDAIDLKNWDMILLFPDCTKMSLSGNRWYGRGKEKHQERIDSIAWTIGLWNKAIKNCDKVALENPLSVIWRYLPNVNYIQPHQFGHGETKKTGFCLKGLPPLNPTNNVDGREQRIWKMPPGPNRKRDRSEFYQGVCDAMADQWGGVVL